MSVRLSLHTPPYSQSCPHDRKWEEKFSGIWLVTAKYSASESAHSDVQLYAKCESMHSDMKWMRERNKVIYLKTCSLFKYDLADTTATGGNEYKYT